MKLTLATIIFILSFLLPQSVCASFQRCAQKIESDCYYNLEEEPQGLAEFEFFWTGEVKGSLISGKAYINKVFIDLTGKLEHERLSFVTSVSQGFTYKFVGRFLPRGKLVKDGKIYIEGKLIKLKGRKTVVSRNVQFYVANGYNT